MAAGIQSNYYDAALLGHQSRVNPDYNKAELRELETQVLEVGLANQDFLVDQKMLSKFKESVNRPVYGYVKNRKASTGGTAMTAFHTGIGGTASQQAITWIAFTEEFFFNETTGMDNVFDEYELFDNEMLQAKRNLRERLRIWLTSNIYTNRTGAGTITSAAMSTLNTTTNTWEISGNAATTPWAAMTSTMRQNKYGYSKYDVFADSLMYSASYEFQNAQTADNATHLAYQFDKKGIMPQKGGYLNNIWEDIILGAAGEVPYTGGYTNGAALVMPEKAFAFLPWMPKLYEDGGGNMDDYAGGYGTIDDEVIPGMTYMVHGWRTQADTTAASGHGYTQDSVLQFQVGFYIAYMTQFISNANETPIYFFGIKP